MYLMSNKSEPREKKNVMSDGYRNIGCLSINNKERNDLGRDHVEGDEERVEKMSNILCRRQLAIDS